MVYSLSIPKKLDKLFLKLSKKNRLHLKIIDKKLNEILKEHHKFKPLRGKMAGIWRVHVGKSFVLTYAIDENSKTVKLLDMLITIKFTAKFSNELPYDPQQFQAYV